MAKIKINKFNYRFLVSLAKNVRRRKINRLDIELDRKAGRMLYFSESIPFIYQVLDHEMDFEIWLHDFPYCVLNDRSRDHILARQPRYRGEKIKKCRSCRYYKNCSGFPMGYFKKYGFGEVQPIVDLPKEVMIEVEPRCNFNCQFCFNKISFAKKGREIKSFSTNYIKKIIDSIARAQIKIIRFTGGEPMLRKDIFELMKYAKDKRLEVRLNTNGSLLSQKTAKKIAGLVDNVLIPIESWNQAREDKITGFKGSLKKKITAIRLLKKINVAVVRIGTVATKENIANFNNLAKFVLRLPIDEWEFYRPIPNSINYETLKSEDINSLVNKIYNLKRKTGKIISIANSIPFCSVKDRNKINAISSGALFDEGHNRLVIDPRGFVKPHYFMDVNVGNPLNILRAWHHPFMKKIRDLKDLPAMCRNCRFRYKCCGGSRYAAKFIYNNWWAADPIIAALKEK